MSPFEEKLVILASKLNVAVEHIYEQYTHWAMWNAGSWMVFSMALVVFGVWLSKRLHKVIQIENKERRCAGEGLYVMMVIGGVLALIGLVVFTCQVADLANPNAMAIHYILRDVGQ